MSSHHFVRENQEPGLYIDHWFSGAEKLLEQLAQWAPKIIVHERILDDVLNTNTKIDIVLYERNLELVEEKTRFQFPIRLEKSKVNFEDNLKLITEKFIDRIHIISNKTPKEHFEIENATLTYFNNSVVFHTINTGFEKWIAKDETFQLLENGNTIAKNGEDTIFKHSGTKAIFISHWTA